MCSNASKHKVGLFPKRTHFGWPSISNFAGHVQVMLKSLWGHFGTTLGPLCGHFGTTLGSIWHHFGDTLGSLWGHFGGTLGAVWWSLLGHFGTTFGSLFGGTNCPPIGHDSTYISKYVSPCSLHMGPPSVDAESLSLSLCLWHLSFRGAPRRPS